MEHEVQVVVRQVVFLGNIFLRVAQDGRGQNYVTGLYTPCTLPKEAAMVKRGLILLSSV